MNKQIRIRVVKKEPDLRRLARLLIRQVREERNKNGKAGNKPERAA